MFSFYKKFVFFFYNCFLFLKIFTFYFKKVHQYSTIKLGEKIPTLRKQNTYKYKSNNSPLLLFLVEKIYSLLYTYAKGGLAMKLKVETKELETKKLTKKKKKKEKGNTFCIIDPQTNLEMAFQLLHTLSLHILNAYTISANGGQLPENPTEEETNKLIAIKTQLYDTYNLAVSSVLEHYAPEFELRPDITADAIAKAEENIVKEKYKHLSPKEKQQANQRIQKFKNQLLKEKASSKNYKDETNKVS